MRLAERQLFSGIDIGGTKIAAVIADSCGQIIAQGVIPTESWAGPAQAVSRASSLLKHLCREQNADVLAIGIGMPGLVDTFAGKVMLLPNLPDKWHGYEIVKEFELQTQKAVFLANDARLAALGEFTFGNQLRSQDLLFVTVGTGVGGGLILDGKLRLGAFGAAGEIGHQTILPEGPLCGCGSRGCLETLVSGPSLTAAGRELLQKGIAPKLRELVAGSVAAVSPATMAIAANNGDTAVAAVIQTAAKYLGVGIANALTITAVGNVVIGGGLSALGSLLLEPVRRVIRERVRMFPSDLVQVSCSTLGENCGTLGGVALAFQEYGRTMTINAQPKSGE